MKRRLSAADFDVTAFCRWAAGLFSRFRRAGFNGTQQEMRPIVYDATHLVSRLTKTPTSGIDQVDLAYADYFSRAGRLAAGLHYSIGEPHRFSPRRVAGLVEEVSQGLRSQDRRAEEKWKELRNWLLSSAARDDGGCDSVHVADRRKTHDHLAFVRQCALRVVQNPLRRTPRGSIYLNIAQHAFEHHLFFKWLEKRSDIMPVFFVHDLLPLDFPEFFRMNYRQRFARRVETIVRRARAIITSSRIGRDRLLTEYRAHGVAAPPIHVQALASPLEADVEGCLADPEVSARPYFVFVSTIEPRKNHLLLLHIWRKFADDPETAPKLVLVGASGWENDQTLGLLRRSASLKPFVRHDDNLPRSVLRKLIANARAVIMPSFVEGYGLPIVEALCLDVPVIVSDTPIFREVSQGAATFVSPIDGEGWYSVLRAFSGATSQIRVDAAARAKSFIAPTWAEHFAGVEAFLESL